MKAYSVDVLLADLAEILPIVNPEQYRRSCKRGVRIALGLIGFNHTAFEDWEEVQVEGYSIPELSDHIVDVMDVGFEPYVGEGYQVSSRGRSREALQFSFTPFGMDFPNFAQGKLWLKIRRFPLDKDGNTQMAEEVYDAVYKYMIGELIDFFRNHPIYAERQLRKQEGKDALSYARAQLNKRGREAQIRTERNYH